MQHPAPIKIVTVEIPVADLERAAAWYGRAFGFERTWTDGAAAMLRLPGGAPPHLFLVRTDDPRRLGFTNTATGIAHGVVDFCTPDLAAMHAHLKGMGAEVTDLRDGARGFAVKDPDGNRLGVCDIEV